jgi:hypothetical protein
MYIGYQGGSEFEAFPLPSFRLRFFSLYVVTVGASSHLNEPPGNY